MPLSQFHPLVQTWFRERFEAPTAAQALGWPAIAQGWHTLIAAPTGSGKTLAAFLTPGPRVPALLDNRVALRDGVPIASLQAGEVHWHTETDSATRSAVLDLLGPRRTTAGASPRSTARVS